MMGKNVTAGEIAFRKAWIQAIVDRAEDHVIRIIGDTTDLEHAVINGTSASQAGVRSSV